MQLETIFQICQSLVLLGWACLLLAPMRRAQMVTGARIVAGIMAVAYLIQFFTITVPTGGDFSSLAGITKLFSEPGNVMLGWTHYLAFDLFVASWEIEDAGRHGIPHWLMIPVLFFTLMLGPIGLLLYFVIRFGWGQFGSGQVKA